MSRNEEDLKRVIAALLETEGRSEDEVRTFQAKAVPGLRDGLSKGTAVKDYSALVAGQRDGKSVSLGRGVAQGAKAIAAQ